ncbi:MAG TPA: PD-(D/E)XK nuclease family protein, partial [Bacteroidota bacterium]|nr:PD-(D/E)XK nuclease family protein [Bacteroidota bacterium]
TELKNFISRDSYSILSEPSIELEALTEKVMAVLRSKFWQNVLSGTDIRTEFTIMTGIDDDILLGTLDRVYRDRDGLWTVLDFKTDTVDSETLARKQAEYEAQLKFYSLLVRKYFGADRVLSCLLFSELPEHPVQVVYSAGELDAFEQELRINISRIRAREFSRPGAPCVGCPFLPSGCTF